MRQGLWFSMMFIGRYALCCDAVISLVAVRRAAVLLFVLGVAMRRLVTWRVVRLYSWFGLPMESRGEGSPKMRG